MEEPVLPQQWAPRRWWGGGWGGREGQRQAEAEPIQNLIL